MLVVSILWSMWCLIDLILLLQAHPRLRPCTDTHCTRVIYALESPRPLRVTCEGCRTQFCFICNVEYHAPAHCETIKQWLQKCRDDSGTANYMAAHTKDCPNCGVVIEKNGGCNHMVSKSFKKVFSLLGKIVFIPWFSLVQWLHIDLILLSDQKTRLEYQILLLLSRVHSTFGCHMVFEGGGDVHH